jgi:hypothetical protein
MRDIRYAAALAALLSTTPAMAGTDALPAYAVLARDGIVVVDGATRRLVPATSGLDTFAFDRDGRSFVATLRDSLVRIDAHTGARTTLVTDHGLVRFPDVDAATGRIAFASSRGSPEGPWRVVVCAADGSDPRDLGSGYDPCFAPDGRILCEDFASGEPRIEWIDPATLARGPLARRDSATTLGHSVQASPDGRIVAFSEADRLHFLARDATLPSPSPQRGAYDRFASFDPESRSVLFFRQQGETTTFVVHDLATGETRDVESAIGGELAAFAPRPPLHRNHLIELSRRNAELPFATRTGLDPVRDHPRALWLETATRESLARDEPGGPWFLNGVRRLLPSEAAALGTLPGGPIFLRDLPRLDLAAARGLGAAKSSELWLDGLLALDTDCLDALLATPRSLVALRGLTSLDVALAARLADVDGALLLDGVLALDAEVAAALAAWSGNGERFVLSLDGLADPDPGLVRTLAATRGWGLSLRGITRLTPELAAALATFRGALLELDGLATIDAEAADLLLTLNAKWVELRGARHVAPATRARLASRATPSFVLP